MVRSTNIPVFVLLRLLAAIITCVAIWSASVAHAEDAFKWVDKHGRTVYGSKPPPSANGVSKMTTHSLSRYSSEKVLNRLGWKDRKTETTEETQTVKGTKKAKEEALPYNSKTAELIAGEPDLETNESGQITACKVRVKNNSDGPAHEISIAFEFPDGTLVPGSGPDDIEKGAEVEYTVPAEILPITISEKHRDPNSSEPLKPRVILHGAVR